MDFKNFFKKRIIEILNKLESFFKTDIFYLFKNSSWITGKRLVGAGTSFVMAIVLANFLPKELYGSYKYVLSVAGFLSLLTLGGLNSALTRSVSKGYEGSLDKVVKTRLKWSVLSTLGLLCISIYYYSQDNLILTTAFLVVSLATPLKQIFTTSYSFLKGKERFDILSKYRSFGHIIATILAVITLYFTNKLWLFLFAYVGGWALLNIIFYILIQKQFKKNKKTEKGLIKYGKQLSIIKVVNKAEGQLESIIIWHFLGAVPLALYSFAVKPVKEIKQLLYNPLKEIALPKFSKKKYGKLKDTLPLKILKSYIFIIPLILMYIIVAPYLYKLVFPKYTDSILLSQVFALMLLFKPKELFNKVLTAHKKVKEKYILSFTMNPLKLILFIVLLPVYGIWGLIYAQLIKDTIHFLLLFYFFKISNSNK